MTPVRALLGGGLAALGVAAATLVVGAGLAAEADSPAAALQVSVDGTVFARSVAGSILDETYALVPGDRLDGRVFVRNVGTATGWVRVTVGGPVAGDPLYLGVLTLIVGDDVARGAADVDECTELVPARRLGVGEVISVPIGMQIPPDAGTEAQRMTAALAVRVTMSDSPHPVSGACAEPVGPVAKPDTASPPGEDMLSTTLAPLGLLVVAAAAALGVALRVDAERRARRRKENP